MSVNGFFSLFHHRRRPSYGRREGETTGNWLERLVNEGAPEATRNNVQAILEAEQRAVGQLSTT